MKSVRFSVQYRVDSVDNKTETGNIYQKEVYIFWEWKNGNLKKIGDKILICFLAACKDSCFGTSFVDVAIKWETILLFE